MKGLIVWLLIVMVLKGSEGFAATKVFSHQIQLIPTIIYGPSTYRQSLTEVIYTLMNSSMQLSIQQVHLTQSKIEVIYSQVHNQIMRSHQNSNDIFDKILSDYVELFQSDTNNEHPCVQKNMEEMRNISSYGRTNALKCVDLAMKGINQIQYMASPYLKSLNSSIESINEVNDQCKQSSNPIWIGICVVENVETVSNAVAGINHDLIESTRLATIETLAIGQNVQECMEKAILSVRKSVEDIVSDSKICAGKSSK
ncbi:uncharacterized protein LOC119077642 [Bradysia coprophila]|uniref:uncharacterized protein LOC119077642 n=1 Tax=Bradysia coprophila TaxID=38358 RepID=UPI00187DA493|nr:uncharacterized protein LOC119077642 [Bradysia coprophila]